MCFIYCEHLLFVDRICMKFNVQLSIWLSGQFLSNLLPLLLGKKYQWFICRMNERQWRPQICINCLHNDSIGALSICNLLEYLFLNLNDAPISNWTKETSAGTLVRTFKSIRMCLACLHLNSYEYSWFEVDLINKNQCEATVPFYSSYMMYEYVTLERHEMVQTDFIRLILWFIIIEDFICKASKSCFN